MTFRDWLGRKTITQPAVVYPAPHGNGWVDLPVENPTTNNWTTAWSGQVPVLDPGEQLDLYAAGLSSLDPQKVWKTQPSVRKVVDFIARSVASTPMKAYQRVSEDVRRPLTNSPLTSLLLSPAEGIIPFRLWHSIMCDWLLYDRWAVRKVPSDNEAGMELIRIPARRVRFPSDALGRLTAIRILTGVPDRQTGNMWVDHDPTDYLYDYGYTPDGAGGLTPMQTLGEILAENTEAIQWRRQVWKNGARLSGWIERPIDANDLEGFDDVAEARFLEQFNARFRANGPEAGGWPLLKDGMTAHEAKMFSASDMATLENRKLSDVEVAASYHIAPELVGAREGNFSNVREYRQSLYRDALGGYFTPIKQVVNAMLVPGFVQRRKLYVDWDIESKVRGSFEERATMTSAAVGAPWHTRNEARAEENLPPVDGGDELITPLNVLVGSQPSPVTPTEDPGDTSPADDPEAPKTRRKALLPEKTRDRLLFDYEAEIRQLVKRQAAAVQSALGGKAVGSLTDSWNQERWDRELGATLNRHLSRSAELRSALVAAQLDADPDLDELRRLVGDRANGIASGFNAKTYALLAAAVVADDWKTEVVAVFAAAAAARAERLALTSTTETTTLAAIVSAKDAGPVFKRWVVRSKNPRPSHRAMSGELVPLDAKFSNGASHPGDGNLPTEERAHCSCDVDLQREDS